MSVERKLAQRIKGSRPTEGLSGSVKQKHPGEKSSHGFLMLLQLGSLPFIAQSLFCCQVLVKVTFTASASLNCVAHRRSGR